MNGAEPRDKKERITMTLTRAPSRNRASNPGRVSIAASAVAIALMLTACQTTGSGGSGSAASQAAPLTVSFADPAWTGREIPSGQHCSNFGGRGASPALTVSDLPADTAQVVVEFNDADYGPLSSNGGHGKIGVDVPAGATTVSVPSVPGETSTMPAGVRLVADTRARGKYAHPGYLPPCSGGRNHTYFADVLALDASGAKVGQGHITLGRY